MAEPTTSELAAQLEVASQALRLADERATAGQLALELMHEIKNPLEALGHLNYLTLHEAEDPEQVRKYMTLAQEQMLMLTEIVSQTLGFTRSAQGPRSIDLLALAEAALRIHQRKIDAKKLHLVKDLPKGVMATIHPGEILQVISNLVANAVDALPGDGTLCLRLRRRDGHVHLVIADNGQGIPTEHRSKIFEPFFTTKNETGNGLGLALSKKIMERHKGRISMRSSVRPGKSGTTFRLSLPA
jgi:signal transduction histidine kinase